MKLPRLAQSPWSGGHVSLMGMEPEPDGIDASSCDPNRDCRRRGPNYPCPTWRNPGRTCESYYDDPVCLTEREVCRHECDAWIAHPMKLQAVAAIRLAKDRGLISDRGQCEDFAGDAGRLAQVVDGALAGAIAGSLGRCSCRDVF